MITLTSLENWTAAALLSQWHIINQAMKNAVAKMLGGRLDSHSQSVMRKLGTVIVKMVGVTVVSQPSVSISLAARSKAGTVL